MPKKATSESATEPRRSGRTKELQMADASMLTAAKPRATQSQQKGETSKNRTAEDEAVESDSADNTQAAAPVPGQTLWDAVWGKTLPEQDVQFEIEGETYHHKVYDLRQLNVEELKGGVPYGDSPQIRGRWQAIRALPPGKTTWLIYVLIKRLEARLPTAIQFFPQEFVLFDDAGPHSITNPMPAEGRLLPRNTWLLSDSGARLLYPSDAFTEAPLSTKIILASSPAFRRWKAWSQQARAGKYVMDVWGDIELVAMLALLGLDIPKGLALAAKWGPCARLVHDCLVDPPFEESHIRTVFAAATNTAKSFSAAALLACEQLDYSDDKLSSSIFFVRPPNRLKHRAFGQVVIPTPFLAKVLLGAITEEQREKQIEFFSVMSNHSSMRVAAGPMFESILHARLSCAGEEIELKAADGSRKRITVPDGIKSIPGTLKDSVPPFYWQPGASNFPGLGSILHDGSEASTIQSTLTSRHKSVKSGLQMVQPELGKQKINVVFVGPVLSQAESARDAERLSHPFQDMSIYACELVLGGNHPDMVKRIMATSNVFRRAMPAPELLLPIFDRPDILREAFPQFSSYLSVSQRARQQIINSEDFQIAVCELSEVLEEDTSRAILGVLDCWIMLGTAWLASWRPLLCSGYITCD